MLSKKICIQCWIKYKPDHYTERGFNWAWNNEEVCCPGKYSDKRCSFRDIKLNPPNKCPYVLEHIMEKRCE